MEICYSRSPQFFVSLFKSTNMLTLKRKHLIWVMCLLMGIGYFSAMSSLEIPNFAKSLIAFIPVQIAAIAYVTVLRWSRG